VLLGRYLYLYFPSGYLIFLVYSKFLVQFSTKTCAKDLTMSYWDETKPILKFINKSMFLFMD